MTTQTTFRTIDEKVNQAIKGTFEVPRALLFGVNDLTDLAKELVGDAVGDEISVTKVTDHGDIYMMLESDEAIEQIKLYTGFAVVTCGWAAPIAGPDDDEYEGGPPSEHPLRRRVKLICFCNNDGTVASSIRFQDDPDNIIVDPGVARGSLADAVQEFNDRVRS